MKRIVFVIGAICAIAGAASFATAAITATPTTTIQACAKGNGDLRIVSAPSDCKPQEASLSWAVVGPKGDPGPTGPQGPSGAAGLQGSTGARRPSRRHRPGRACGSDPASPALRARRGRRATRASQESRVTKATRGLPAASPGVMSSRPLTSHPTDSRSKLSNARRDKYRPAAVQQSAARSVTGTATARASPTTGRSITAGSAPRSRPTASWEVGRSECP